MKRPLLFLPGPMQVPDPVGAAANRPLFSHRSKQMLDLRSRLQSGLRPVFGTGGDIVFLASSGTGAMESAVVNLSSPGDEVVVVVGGVFAERWLRIAEAYNLTVHVAAVNWRTGASVTDVERALDRCPAAKAVFITWSESSTGVLIELDGIGHLVRQRGKVLVVDAVSGLGVSPLAMDALNLDVVVAGSQKGLMLPPGLGIVAVGPRAWERATQAKAPRFYWDWRQYKSGVPFTPPLGILLQLEASLEFIGSMGLEQLYRRHTRVAEVVRELVHSLDMEVYALRPGNGITTIVTPPGLDAGMLRRRLESDHGIAIAGGQGRLKDTAFRIGHVGHVSDEELEYFTTGFRRTVEQLKVV